MGVELGEDGLSVVSSGKILRACEQGRAVYLAAAGDCAANTVSPGLTGPGCGGVRQGGLSGWWDEFLGGSAAFSWGSSLRVSGSSDPMEQGQGMEG